MSHSTLNSRGQTFSCNVCLTDLKVFEALSSTGSTRGVKQYLSSCYHVLCLNCRVKGAQKCLHCNKKCEFMEISNKMPKHIQWFFGPSSAVRNHLMKVMQFQKQQELLTISRKMSQARYFQEKCNNQVKELQETEVKYRLEVEKYRKIKIIFDKLCEEKRRKDGERRERRSSRDGRRFSREEDEGRRYGQDARERRHSRGRRESEERRHRL